MYSFIWEIEVRADHEIRYLLWSPKVHRSVQKIQHTLSTLL